ncbi:SDR family oxidoreductase [Streptomyces tailanensis]|uniref:SDR family oxidoreductase n=1 Tax=Streptomyces tailanensis TaxID=2569858 RepID=UPI0024829588|nr:SDR family oxidoreductase [Streptomyces tailanensis]
MAGGTDGQNEQQMRDMLAMSAARRLGTPDDIAAAAEFLRSPQAGHITGTDLLVDGGVTRPFTRRRPSTDARARPAGSGSLSRARAVPSPSPQLRLSHTIRHLP